MVIDKMLRDIAHGQYKYGYAMIPRICYDDWKKLRSFRNENEFTETDENGDQRRYLEAFFTDDDYCLWRVVFTDCRHPDKGPGWLYVVRIDHNRTVFSHTKVSIEEYEAKYGK